MAARAGMTVGKQSVGTLCLPQRGMRLRPSIMGSAADSDPAGLLVNSVYYKLRITAGLWNDGGFFALPAGSVSIALFSLWGISGSGSPDRQQAVVALFIFLLSRTDAFDWVRDTMKGGQLYYQAGICQYWNCRLWPSPLFPSISAVLWSM